MCGGVFVGRYFKFFSFFFSPCSYGFFIELFQELSSLKIKFNKDTI